MPGIVRKKFNPDVDPSKKLEWKEFLLNLNTMLDDIVRAINTSITGTSDGTNFIKFKVVEIGDWNMVSTQYVNILHGVTWENIRPPVSVLIRNDGNTEFLDFTMIEARSTGGVIRVNSSYITLYRSAGGGFDSADYDATSYNRGWITFFYV